jgi:diacylglycerol O-acyltransferase / wax synthase
MTEFMRNTDAFTWAMESDPRLRSTVVTVIVLDRTPDWAEVRRRFELISRVVPMVRQRVVTSPASAPPRWQHTPDFDLDFHMRRVTAPAPGTLDTVLELARVAEMEDFDRARPLWAATMIDGLENGRAALLLKFHHALTDGVGGIQLGMILFDSSEAPEPGGPTAGSPDAPRPRWLGGYRDAARYQAGLIGSALSGTVKMAPKLVVNGLRHPVDTVSSTLGLAASVYRTVRPVNRTGSTLMSKRSLIRRLGVLEVPLAQLRASAHCGGGALNDAFVASVAGGLRRYHEHHGVPVGDLHLTMPISLRAADDELGGNRITLMRFDVPVGLADPAERIRQIHQRTARVRHEKSLPHTQLIAGALNLVPRWYIGSILRNVDFLCSDVPGIPIPVFLGGARVVTQYAFGPTTGSAVNVTLLTYVDVCTLGVDVDTGAIPDFDVFFECLLAGFAEVLTIGSPEA